MKGLENGRGVIWMGDSSQDYEGHTVQGLPHAQAWGFGSRYRLVLDSPRLR